MINDMHDVAFEISELSREVRLLRELLSERMTK